MANNNEKESRYRKYRTVSVYFPKEIREQLLFYCRYINIAPSTLCSKLVKLYLSKKNVEQLMIDYAMQEIEKNSQQNKK